ncbi:hypothetical protein KAR91_60995 [Candidatus Pacearchaeota archaeon]|nr:hypothetical protein [Candidatus Pacearchaeota archaeon]
MDIQQLWLYVNEVLSPLDFVAIIMIYFLTNQFKTMVKKKYRRLTVVMFAGIMVMAIMWATPSDGPFGGHIHYREGFIYIIVYTAMPLAMYHLLKRFGKGEYDGPDRRNTM